MALFPWNFIYKQALGGFGLWALSLPVPPMDGPKEVGKSVNIFVLHFNDHKRAFTHGRATRQPSRQMTQVDASQPLLSSTPVLTQLAQERNSHRGRFGDSEWAPKQMLPPTNADLATIAT